MERIKKILQRKAIKTILAAAIAAGLAWAGFSGDLAKMISDESADILIEQVVE